MAEKLNNSQDQPPRLELDKLTDEQIEAVLEAYEEVSDEGIGEYQDNDEYQEEMRLRVTEALRDTGFDVGDEVINGSLNVDQLVTDTLNEGLRRDKYTQEFEKDVEEIERLKVITDKVESLTEGNKKGQDNESFKVTVTSPRLARRMAIQEALKGTEHESDFGDASGAEDKYAEIESRIAEIESKYLVDSETDTEPESKPAESEADSREPEASSRSEPVATDGEPSGKDTERKHVAKSEVGPTNESLIRDAESILGALNGEDSKRGTVFDTSEAIGKLADDLEWHKLRTLAGEINDERNRLKDSEGLSSSERSEIKSLIEKREDELQVELDKFKENSNMSSSEIKRIYDDIVGLTGVYEDEPEASEADAGEKEDDTTPNVVESFDASDNGEKADDTPEKKKRFARLKKIGAAVVGVWNRADLKVHEAMIAFGSKRPFGATEQQEHESDEEYKERLERRGAVKGAAIAMGALAIAATASIARQKGWFEFEPYSGGGPNSLGGETITPETTPDGDASRSQSTPEAGPESDTDGGAEVDSGVEGLSRDGLSGPVAQEDIGPSATLEGGGGTEQQIMTIHQGEGWSDTIKEMGTASADREAILEHAGPKLVDIGIAYEDESIGGGYGIARTGEMPQEAIDIIIETADQLGVDINARGLYSK